VVVELVKRKFFQLLDQPLFKLVVSCSASATTTSLV
jgi:hypothetical protein